MSASDLELGSMQQPPSSFMESATRNSSSFDIPRHDRAVFSSTRDATSHRDRNTQVEHKESPILAILRISSHHKVRIFPTGLKDIPSGRQVLAKGSTFYVDTSTIRIREAALQYQYRQPDLFRITGEKFLFTDHTGTNWEETTKGAFKSLVYTDDINKEDVLMKELITELRVLCHPPLQRHPNIVRLLGLEWIRDEEIFRTGANVGVRPDASSGETREWPTMVTEKADHGSLRSFLGSDKYRLEFHSSLPTKILLCLDVLNGIAALHACDIYHGDIKCDNALVYTDLGRGTAQNWKVALVDFGQSILLNPEETSPEDINVSRIQGTQRYAPPRLDSTQATIEPQDLKAMDMWCFGLLFCEVMLDDNLPTSLIENYRDRLSTADSLVAYCRRYLMEKHAGDGALIEVALELLNDCLHLDHRHRSPAEDLVTYLQNKLGLQGRYTVLQPEKVASLEDLPFFDLSSHYYDLLGTISVPGRVVKALEDTVSSPDSYFLASAEFQLGLCYLSGFGVETDGRKALEHICKAARARHVEAGVVIPRICSAIGIPIDATLMHELLPWLEEAADMGSTAALHDIHSLTGESDGDWCCPWPMSVQPRQALELPRLHRAVVTGRTDEVIRYIKEGLNVNARGPCQEVALHYTNFLPVPNGSKIAEILIEAGADIFAATTAGISFSQRDFICNEISSGRSPLQMAIFHDNVTILDIFMSRRSNQADPRLWSPENILSFVARYQSMRCLEYLLEDDSWARTCKVHLNKFDRYGLSTMYHACRPDLFERLYLMAPVPNRSIPFPPDGNLSPLANKELKIIQLLHDAGSPTQILEHDIFTAVHVLTAFGDADLLDRLLSTRTEWSALKNKPRKLDGWTPMRDAIARGRLATFDVLIRHNIDLKNIRPYHNRGDVSALHLCCLRPGSIATQFAKSILAKDVSLLFAKDFADRIPLHFAALAGHTKLIQHLIEYQPKKASKALHARDALAMTPLGYAVYWRAVPAIYTLCAICKERSIPAHSLRRILRLVHPVEQLLAPGANFGPGLVFQYPMYLKFGAAEHPFSDASVDLLRGLLEHYPSTTKFGDNLIQDALYHPIILSGVVHAVRVGNHQGVKAILDHFDEKVKDLRPAHLRLFLFEALDQLLIAKTHLASEQDRRRVIYFVWSKYEKVYGNIKGNRVGKRNLVGLYWRMYYRTYGETEHGQLAHAKVWLESHRFCDYRPSMLEFEPWHAGRRSPGTIANIVLLLFEIPTVALLIAIAKEPLTKWNHTNTMWAAIAFLLPYFLPHWPKALRVVSVYYNTTEKQYNPHRAVRTLLQSFVCLSVVPPAIFCFWILYPATGRLLAYTMLEEVEALDDGSYFEQDVQSNSRYLSHFQSLCALVQTWLILCVVVPVLFHSTKRFVLGLRYHSKYHGGQPKEMELAQLPPDNERRVIVRSNNMLSFNFWVWIVSGLGQ